MRKHKANRHGSTLVLMVLLMLVILGMAAFAVDIGRMHLVRSQMQTAVDSGAIAGALQLKRTPDDLIAAQDAAKEFVQRQHVGFLDTVPSDAIVVDTGKWDTSKQKFSVTTDKPNAIRVSASQNNEPFFFASVFGRTGFSIPRASIAVAGPSKLDILMILDLSTSMGSSGRIEALRDAAPVFVQVIKNLQHDDRLGVMCYGAQKGTYGSKEYTATPASLFPTGTDYATGRVGVLEKTLTGNLDSVISGALSPSELDDGKYGGGTPIGAAIRDSAHYLTNNGRSGVAKQMVLMSDGQANYPSADPTGYALEMANYANSLGIKLHTISLGDEADTTFMTSLATATGGLHFDATGSTASLSVELTNAFVASANEMKKTTIVN